MQLVGVRWRDRIRSREGGKREIGQRSGELMPHEAGILANWNSAIYFSAGIRGSRSGKEPESVERAVCLCPLWFRDQ